jgi:histidinol-phosphate aminotransferase
MSDDESALTRRDWLVTGGIALDGLALPARSSGEEIVAHPARARLSLNENPFGPSSFALAAIGKQLGEVCHYPDDGGDRLTRALVTRENVSADQIVLGEILGPLGLHLAMNGPGGGDSSIRSPATPLWWMRWRLVEGWSIIPLDQYLQNDLSAIAAKVSSRTRAIYLVNPHNPSGTVNDTESFTTFVRDMSKRTTVIVDEAYLEFEPDFAARTAAGLTRAGENVVVFRTFGKIYGLAGLSMGYAVAPKALAACGPPQCEPVQLVSGRNGHSPDHPHLARALVAD